VRAPTLGVRLDGAILVHPNGHRALRGVSLQLGAGERAAVIGPSGAGKTTLVRVLATSLRPTQGRLALGGSIRGSSALTRCAGCAPGSASSTRVRRSRRACAS
jgi:ABC-type multidrug transport system ATPase subunit